MTSSFVPNYLKHAPLGYKVNVEEANNARTHSLDRKQVRSNSPSMRSNGNASANNGYPLAAAGTPSGAHRREHGGPSGPVGLRILKVRLVGKEHFDKDFIEVDIPLGELCFRKLVDVICDEFTVNPLTVVKIRKMPNTKLRRDVEVMRLCDYQELEVEIADI